MFGRVTGLLRRVGSVWRVTRRTVERVPDVVEAILVLPRLSQQLEVIEVHTANLEEMREEIARLRGDTAALAEMALPLQSAAIRVGRVADRWPARGRPLGRP